MIKISKIYHRSVGEIVDYDLLPVIQIWPNFETVEENVWQAYYSFFDAPIGWQRRTFYAEPYWNDIKPRSIETNKTYAEIIVGKKIFQKRMFVTLLKKMHLEIKRTKLV